jgi:hypothetical protein
VILLSDRGNEAPAGVPVTAFPARQVGLRQPFLVYYGEGPAYALLGGTEGGPLYHTADRSLVEHMAFELQRDLGIAISA